MNDPDDQFARQMSALGHPARLKILRWLARYEKCRCKDVVDVLPLAQSTVSQHLKVLTDAGLVKAELARPSSHYCLDRQALSDLAAATGLFAEICCEQPDRSPKTSKQEYGDVLG